MAPMATHGHPWHLHLHKQTLHWCASLSIFCPRGLRSQLDIELSWSWPWRRNTQRQCAVGIVRVFHIVMLHQFFSIMCSIYSHCYARWQSCYGASAEWGGSPPIGAISHMAVLAENQHWRTWCVGVYKCVLNKYCVYIYGTGYNIYIYVCVCLCMWYVCVWTVYWCMYIYILYSIYI